MTLNLHTYICEKEKDELAHFETQFKAGRRRKGQEVFTLRSHIADH